MVVKIRDIRVKEFQQLGMTDQFNDIAGVHVTYWHGIGKTKSVKSLFPRKIM